MRYGALIGVESVEGDEFKTIKICVMQLMYEPLQSIPATEASGLQYLEQKRIIFIITFIIVQDGYATGDIVK